MARVKRGVVARKRHKKILKLAKGYYGARSRVFRVAKQAVIKAGQYAYRDRRQKKTSVPRSVDRSYQRWCSYQRSVLQPFHRRPEKSFHRDRP